MERDKRNVSERHICMHATIYNLLSEITFPRFLLEICKFQYEIQVNIEPTSNIDTVLKERGIINVIYYESQRRRQSDEIQHFSRILGTFSFAIFIANVCASSLYQKLKDISTGILFFRKILNRTCHKGHKRAVDLIISRIHFKLHRH